jgi:hypothetical protein
VVAVKVILFFGSSKREKGREREREGGREKESQRERVLFFATSTSGEKKKRSR